MNECQASGGGNGGGGGGGGECGVATSACTDNAQCCSGLCDKNGRWATNTCE